MLSNSDYLMAWSIYLLSATALLITGWRLSSWMWSWAKDALRVVSAVLLLAPASVDGDPAHLAPTMVIVCFELLTAEVNAYATIGLFDGTAPDVTAYLDNTIIDGVYAADKTVIWPAG